MLASNTNQQINVNDGSVILIRASDVILQRDTTNIESRLLHKHLSDQKDISLFMINHSLRRTMPYGIWTCEDGREVVFNREYQPILQRKDGINSFANQSEWINDIAKVEYLFNDYTSPLSYLTQKIDKYQMDRDQRKSCKKTLAICIQVLKDYTPEEDSGSINRSYSVKQL